MVQVVLWRNMAVIPRAADICCTILSIFLVVVILLTALIMAFPVVVMFSPRRELEEKHETISV